MKTKNLPKSKNVEEYPYSLSSTVNRASKGDRLPNRSLGGAYKEDPQTLRDRLLISKHFKKAVRSK